MTWQQHCDGPACTRTDVEDVWTVKEPGAVDYATVTDLHFCSQDCIMRWAAGVPASLAAVEDET